MSERCDYCDTTGIVYPLESDRGSVSRCIECLAIEQLQQQVSLPFDVWVDRDDIEPPDQEKFPNAPDFGSFDPVEHDYNTVRAWATVLARLKDDDPILKRDADSPAAIFEDTRTFITDIMGDDAFRRPSYLRTLESESNDTEEHAP